eukprot:TRINITY_DN1935_c0_g1_i39.p2 TRINITY_DN1935_c0_g1~~TRINITY_DN1935_c0_g1_i39.p2  ORF type:complete len:167 (+),score=23.47 TRINITY_DN1935_c0_g1_i39:203-703(+)
MWLPGASLQPFGAVVTTGAVCLLIGFELGALGGMGITEGGTTYFIPETLRAAALPRDRGVFALGAGLDGVGVKRGEANAYGLGFFATETSPPPVTFCAAFGRPFIVYGIEEELGFEVGCFGPGIENSNPTLPIKSAANGSSSSITVEGRSSAIHANGAGGSSRGLF